MARLKSRCPPTHQEGVEDNFQVPLGNELSPGLHGRHHDGQPEVRVVHDVCRPVSMIRTKASVRVFWLEKKCVESCAR
eukprot:1139967-Pelagomonas_calceolata.AAC.3